MARIKPTLSAFYILLAGLILASCDKRVETPERFAANFYDGVPVTPYLPRGSIIPGNLYRTNEKGPFVSVANSRPLCTDDVALIAPISHFISLDETNRNVDPYFSPTLIRATHPNLENGSAYNFIENVHVQFNGVVRQFIDESEINRTNDRLGSKCREIIQSYLEKGHTVVIVKSVVIAKNVLLTATFDTERLAALKAAPQQFMINGLAGSSIGTFRGSNAIVEITSKTIGDPAR